MTTLAGVTDVLPATPTPAPVTVDIDCRLGHVELTNIDGKLDGATPAQLAELAARLERGYDRIAADFRRRYGWGAGARP